MPIITTIKSNFTNTTDFIRGTSSTLIEAVTNNHITNNINKIKEKGKEYRLLKQAEKKEKQITKMKAKIAKLWNEIEKTNETIENM